jgi:hypothetical protein
MSEFKRTNDIAWRPIPEFSDKPPRATPISYPLEPAQTIRVEGKSEPSIISWLAERFPAKEQVESFAGLDPLPKSALGTQVGGSHYKKLRQYQPWEVLAAWLTPDELRGAAKMAAIKYLARERDKGGVEDIEKAMHTLQIYLELIKKKSNGTEALSVLR